jgi:multidrug efflux pump
MWTRHGEGAPPGREVIALGVSMAKGGDIIALGKALQAAANASMARCRRREAGAGAGPAQVGGHLGERVRQGADRGGGDRAGGELYQPGAAQAPGQPPAVEALVHRPTPGLVVGITIPLVLA